MLLRVGFRTPGVLLALSATLVLVTLVSVNSELTGTFGAIAGLWFAVHQVPLSIGGTALGVFPLLPTIVLVVVVVKGVSRAVGSTSTRRDCAVVFGAAVLGPLVVTVIALAVAADASAAIAMNSPHVLLAFAWVAGIHALAAGVGVGIGTWNSDAVVERAPDWTRRVVSPTMRAGAVLAAGAGAIVLAALAASWSTTQSLLEAGDGLVGVLGLTVLSILYLPNVIVGALAVSVGSSAHVGDVAVSMFQTSGGPVPPLPVLAVLPEGAAQTGWLLMLIVPIAAGVFLGRDCARRAVDVPHALSSVWLGASVLGVAALLVGFAAGGNLGTFGTIEVTVWSLGLLVFAWVAVVGSVAAAIVAWRRAPSNDEDAHGTDETDGTDGTAVADEPEPAAIEAIAQPAALEEGGDDSMVVEEAEIVEEAAAVGGGEDDADSADDVMDAEIVTPAPEEDSPPVEGDATVVKTEADPEDAMVVEAETTEDLPGKGPSASD